jgi:lathosterol oxidase
VLDGYKLLDIWFVALLAAGLLAGILTGFFKARKIQPRGFKWKILRNEALFAAINMAVTGVTLGPIKHVLTAKGYIAFQQGTPTWWMIVGEYALYFVLFDTWFYWLHRAMHKEPFYRWIHKIHHRSTSPNLLTTFSESPLESIINGGFVPLFLVVFTVHPAAAALILPTNVIMGLYVHAGYEFLPRWWNRTWATKWFITTTFHDQHHKYFNYNFGGYTTLWDRICGTQRKKYETDFVADGEKRKQPARPAKAIGVTAGGQA